IVNAVWLRLDFPERATQGIGSGEIGEADAVIIVDANEIQLVGYRVDELCIIKPWDTGDKCGVARYHCTWIDFMDHVVSLAMRLDEMLAQARRVGVRPIAPLEAD